MDGEEWFSAPAGRTHGRTHLDDCGGREGGRVGGLTSEEVSDPAHLPKPSLHPVLPVYLQPAVRERAAKSMAV